MYLVYKILREIRYIMRSKSMKRLVTLALILVLFMILCSRVFAITVDTGNNVYQFEDFNYSGFDTRVRDSYYLTICELTGTMHDNGYGYMLLFIEKSGYDKDYLLYNTGDNNYKSFDYYDNSNPVRYFSTYYDTQGNLKKYGKVSVVSGTTPSGAGTSGTYIARECNIVYSDLRCMSVYQYELANYTITLSTNEQTEGPLYFYTNWLSVTNESYYSACVTMFPDTAGSLNFDMSVEYNPSNGAQFRFVWEIPRNDTYDIVLSYSDENFSDTQVFRRTVTNLIDNTGGGTTGGDDSGGNTGGGAQYERDYTENFNDLKQGLNNTTTAINNQTQVINNQTNAINNQTQVISDQTNAINNQTQVITDQTNAINNQTDAINEQTNAINGTTQAVDETNDFLKDTSVDDTQFDMPTVEVNDPTANFFDTMFTGLYNAVTSNEDKEVTVSLLGSNFTINSADFNFLQGNAWSIIRTILSAMWCVGIGLYILKDIRKMINKIKDGNIENVTNDDIKADIV